jgi:hypothetical protein
MGCEAKHKEPAEVMQVKSNISLKVGRIAAFEKQPGPLEFKL